MRAKIKLVDTTLRDGEQAPGLAFTLETRLLLAAALDQAGFHQLEVGSPVMGQKEIEAVKRIKEVSATALISVWNRVRIEDVLASLEAQPDIIHLALPFTKGHLEKKVQKTFAAVAEDLAKCLDLAQSQGAAVSVGLEDVSRAKDAELDQTLELLGKLKVKRVRLSDTVGLLSPGRVTYLVKKVVAMGFSVEFHGHNDLGLAEANAYLAALAGAVYLDTTLSGVGERAGNSSLSRFLTLAALDLDSGVSLAAALELEKLAQPFLEREGYIRELAFSRAPAVEKFW
ncbi:MAG: homocitrate synthase [Deltaproteobacteria bacterium]|nr:homocitrate synthase [Deltaproteobacteria bacterium]